MQRALVAVVLLLAAAGCKKTLHWKIFEDEIPIDLAPQLPNGITFAKVDCPETEVKVGVVIRCRVVLSDHWRGDVETTLLDLAGKHTMPEVVPMVHP